MADKLMYSPNDNTQITHPVYYNYWLNRLYTILNESTNQNLLKVPKVVQSAIKKTLLKLWVLV